MVRILIYLVSVLLVIVLIGSIAGLILARQYQDEVKQLMITELNRHIRTEVRVSDISLSMLRKFPMASVEFNDVLIRIPGDYKFNELPGTCSDTLFSAQKLFLQFNIKDIFHRQYNIKKIHAVNGVVYLAINSEEEENFRFWKSPDSSDKGFNLDLHDMRLDNYRLKFKNSIKNIYFDSDLNRLKIKGNFSHSSYRLHAEATGVNREFKYQDILFGGNQYISLQVDFNVDNDSIRIEEGNIDISGIKLAARGRYEIGETGFIEMDFNAYNLDIASLTPLLTKDIQKGLELWKFNGKFDMEATATGNISKSLSPSIIASFNSQGGDIINKNTGVKLSNINLSGYYSNGSLKNPSSSNLVINNFSSTFGNGKISARGNIFNISKPIVDFDIAASVLLEELAEFYKPENVREMAGRINTEFSIRGNLQKPVKWDIEEFNKMDIEGLMEIENGLLEISEKKHIASNITGDLFFGKSLITSKLSFNTGSDHFSISGEILNGLPWLLGNDITMSISGSLHSENLNLDNYLYPASDSPLRADISESLLFPGNLNLNLDFIIDNFNFRKFSSTNISGKLSYKPRMMVLNAVDFDALEGNISGNGVIVQSLNGDFMVQSQLQMHNVDIQKMFISFNNFGQKFIHGDNLKGNLSGSLSLISEWNSGLQLKSEKIVADSKVKIVDGELIEFKPMLGLARFIDVFELQHIRFSTLENEIFVNNQIVTIPQMDINSSAFNITGSGTHNFDGNFNYRMRVLLSDVLYSKAKRARSETNKYGVVEDDGLGRTSLYLLVSGTPDDYKVSYDQRAVRDVIRENIANERKGLKQLLNEEFGLFSRDSSVISGTRTNETTRQGFRIVWDEEDKKSLNETGPAPASPNTRESREKRFQIIWDEDEKPASEPVRIRPPGKF